ncbi:DUF7935 family protein [Mucilaginibacter sp. KACC 22063]|uniref:DUF7935 family protein n=1 Tax=Mucilaginibacter sp. KACC 22063 TaxID=3025666 RepID=UPI002365425F|nr:hypothetical protein [Mucilaginibacter sp. KACC 22063]WDF56324.1 hypothetical protein PQ461_04515 [Mucilaginibacter sp. KACC 22063]
MLSLNYILDIIKLTIAGIGVVWVAFYLLKPYLERSESLQLLEFKKATSTQTLPLRLQAYERLILLIDRINPANLLIRLSASGYTAAELHVLVLAEVRNEFQHNITQQIYVSPEAWVVAKKIKDDTITLINNVFKSLPADASGLDASKMMLAHLGGLEDNPYDIASNMIKKDLEKLF